MAEITITGSASQVIKRIESLPGRLDQELASGLQRGLLYAVGVAQRQYLSGPRPGKLDIVTRRLRDSIVSEVEVDKVLIGLEYSRAGGTQQRFSGSGNIVGRMGSNVQYAAYHEFGFHGTVNVKAHTRVTRQTVEVGKRGEFGKDVELVDTRKTTKSKSGDAYRESRKSASSRQKSGFVAVGFVKTHSRRVDYAGRPYVRPALEDSMNVISRELSVGMENTAKK